MSYVVAATNEPVRNNRDFNLSAIRSAAKASALGFADHIPDSTQPLLNSNGVVNADTTADRAFFLGLLPVAVSLGLVRKVDTRTGNLVRENAIPMASMNWPCVCAALKLVILQAFDDLRISRLLFATRRPELGEVASAYVNQRAKHHVLVTEDKHMVKAVSKYLTVMPSYFSLMATHLIDTSTLERFDTNMFDGFVAEMLRQLLVAEDTVTRNALLASVPAADVEPLDQLDLDRWLLLKEQSTMPMVRALLPHDLWLSSIRAGLARDLVHYQAPVNHDDAFTGDLGSLAGVAVHTDGHRSATQRVLRSDEIFMTSSRECTGSVFYHENVSAQPVNQVHGVSHKTGLHLTKLQAMVVVDTKAVVRGIVR